MQISIIIRKCYFENDFNFASGFLAQTYKNKIHTTQNKLSTFQYNNLPMTESFAAGGIKLELKD